MGKGEGFGKRQTRSVELATEMEKEITVYIENCEKTAIKKIDVAEDKHFLRGKCLPIGEVSSKTLHRLAEAMGSAMFAANGVGLAAPQIGLKIRCFTVALRACTAKGAKALIDGAKMAEEQMPDALFFMNPLLLEVSPKMETDFEGCLSVPNATAEVSRPAAVTMEFHDCDFRRHSISATKLLARCLLHENDHLDGVLCIDRVIA